MPGATRWLPLPECILFSILLVLFLPPAAVVAKQKLDYQQQTLHHKGKKYTLSIPRGYKLEVLNDKLDTPRLLTFKRNGDLFIGSGGGKVYRLTPPYRSATTLVELDDYPHSIALRGNSIFIARTHGLYRAPYKSGQARLEKEKVKRILALPGGWVSHTSRTVAIGPDKRVYVSLGISGNCSDEYLSKHYPFKDRRGGILVLDESGAKPQWKTYASGLRNPVGFAWHPVTQVMYASNNGPDHLGFEQPPEYFARVTAGSFHGMPWFQYDGKTIHRDNCIRRNPPQPMDKVSVPVATFPARNAPMGVAFVTAQALDKHMENDAVVALKGSWGTQPSGSAYGDKATRRPPKLVLVRFENGRAQSVEDLVRGFQDKRGRRWARPVGVAIGPDGALYFTSDSGLNGLFRLSKEH